MAAFDYGELRDTASELIAEFGQSASLIPVTVADAWNPAPTEGTPVTITVVDLNEQIRDSAGMLTGETKRTLIVSTAAGVTPTKRDKITLGGAKHEIAEVRPLAPGGVVLLWEVDLAA